MTRVEHHNEEDHEQLKREIEDDLRSAARRKRMRGCIITLAVALIVILVPVIWAGSVIARTGLATVPLLSSRLYKPAEPVREVVPLVGSKPSDIVNTIGARSRYDLTTGLVHTTASEQELTTLIRASVTDAGRSLPLELEDAQIAVENGFLEFSATSVRDGRTVPLIVQAVPSAKDGVFEVEIKEVVIGGYAVPDALVDTAFAMFGEQVLDSARQGIDRLGTLLRVDLTEGSVAVTFQPNGADDKGGSP